LKLHYGREEITVLVGYRLKNDKEERIQNSCTVQYAKWQPVPSLVENEGRTTPGDTDTLIKSLIFYRWIYKEHCKNTLETITWKAERVGVVTTMI